MPPMDLVFFDTETTGLNPDINGVIEIACIRTNPDASKIIDEYESKIVLEPSRYSVDQKALEINGYSPEKWADAKSLESVMEEIVKRMPFGVQLAGHNTAFDVGMLKGSLRRAGMKIPNFYYHTVDTMSMGQPLVVKGHVPNVKLVTLAKHFGVGHENAHTAMGDVRATIGVYRAILAFYPELPAPAVAAAS